MALTKLLFNPGINKESTDLMDKGGWADDLEKGYQKKLVVGTRQQLKIMKERVEL